MFSLQLIAIQLCCFWRHKMPPPDKFELNFKQSCKQKMKFIFQNTHENNRLSVKNCSHVLQFKVFWDYDSTIIKRSRRSGFTTSLQKFWTVFHFFLVYSTSRFIDTFSEVTDLGSDTASQQSNFLTWSIWALIFLQRPNISGAPYAPLQIYLEFLSAVPRLLLSYAGYGLWIDLQFQRLCITFYPFPPACCGLLDNFHTKL